MSKNEMDQLMRYRFDEWQIPIREEPWDAIFVDLHQPVPVPRRQFNPRLIKIAAALLLFGVAWTAVLYNYIDKEADKSMAGTPQLQKPLQEMDVMREASAPVVPANQPMSNMVNNFPVANAYSRYLNKPFNLPGQRGVVTINEEPEILASALPAPDVSTSSASGNKLRMYDEQSGKMSNPMSNLSTPPSINYPATLPERMATVYKNKPGFRLDVVGALGYGGQTNGYSVGLQTRHHISNRIFVDNMVAFGSTQQEYQLQQFQTPMLNSMFASVAAKGQASTQQNMSLRGNVYFVTLAPSIGFQLNRLLSLSAGGDVQRIVNNQVKTPDNFYNNFVADDNGSMIISQPVKWRNWDAGITAKANVRLSQKVDVGLQYRQGMVNLLSDQQGMELRRSYGGISLQYRILGKQDKAAE